MTFLFWAAAILIAYTYFGYAAWLWMRAVLAPWPVLRASHIPAVSVVMIVRNEERWIESKMKNLLNLDYPEELCQIVVVSDGSTDQTENILRQYSEHPRVQVLMKNLACGKAAGLNDAIDVTAGEVVVFTDVRQKIERGGIRLLVENFVDPEIGCVSGALILGDPDSGEAVKGMGLYWRIEKKIRELESRSGSVVGATGAIYAVRRELVQQVPEGTILDDVYIPMQVLRKGKRVVLDDRARAWDIPDLGGGLEFSRKVRTLSGNYQLIQLAPWLLTCQNPVFGRFVSHKLLRLVIPFALAVMLMASFWLSAPLYRVALIFQLVFYALSVVSLFHLANKGIFARVADAAGTFVVLNSAALVAFANFVSGRKAAWGR